MKSDCYKKLNHEAYSGGVDWHKIGGKDEGIVCDKRMCSFL